MGELMETAKVAADLDFAPEAILVKYDEPWSWWKLAGYRRVRRIFVVRPRTLRDLIIDNTVFTRLRANYTNADGGLDVGGYFTTYCAQIIGPKAIHLPADVLDVIAQTYSRVNHLGVGAAPQSGHRGEKDTTRVTFDALIRRLERAPFNLPREQVLDLTCAQIESRLAEWGTEKINDAKAEAAARIG